MMNGKTLALAACAAASAACAQEIVKCGEGTYASYAPWRVARSTRHWGDQSRIMQTRPIYMTERRRGDPIPTNDWWTDALVSRWTGNLWSYPAKVRIGADGVRVENPSYWIDNGTEMKSRSAIVVSAVGDFAPEATLVDDWHDWDVEMVLREEGIGNREEGSGTREIKTTLVHGSPFTWIESKGVGLKVSIEKEGDAEPRRRAKGNAEIIAVGDELYGIWRGKREGGEWIAVGLLPDESAFEKLAPYATSVIRSTRVDWKYDEKKSTLTTTWRVKTEDIRGTGNGERGMDPVALQGFQPHHLKKTVPDFKTIDGLVWQTPRGKQRVAAGNSLSITYTFPGMLPYWAAPVAAAKGRYDESLFRDLISDYAARGGFGGDTYWGGKGLLQMAFAMMAAREIGDAKTFRDAHAKLRAKFEDWLTWDPSEQRFFFSYVPKWGGLVGEGTSYDSDAFNDHHFHYGYFTYSGALLCMVDEDFRTKFGPMLRLIAKDYANWEREGADASGSGVNASKPRFPFFRTFDPWAGHSFAGGVGDGGGNGQESTSEAMQGWGGLYLLGLALGDDAMRDAGIFGYVSEARGVAEYWFDRDRENIDYTKYKHPYNSNLTCHGVGWWTYFSGDPVWMHSIQWLPNTPALDYLSEDLKFAKWDWETMWNTKEIGGWFEKGKTRDGHETNPVGNESLGNVLLSYLQRHDPAQAAEIFDKLRAKKMGAAMNADTGHMTYWATHSHLTYGELDFSVKADYPCARAFVKNGKRTLMAYNCGDEPRKVRFFGADGKTVGEIVAQPRCLTVQNRKPAGVPKIDLSGAASVIPKGVVMRDLASGASVKATSQESGGLSAANATDGDDKTRWSSAHDDAEATLTIDLGRTVELYGSEILWEASYAAKYFIEYSADGAKWSAIGGERNGFAGLQKLDFGGEKGRFLRMRAKEKATQYGVSLFSWRVFGKPAGAKGALGAAIDAEKPVLKEDVPCRLSARAWLGGEKFSPCKVEWSSADGEFDGDMFTPRTNGFATVEAKMDGLAVSRRFPVEEALRAVAFTIGPKEVEIPVGKSVKLAPEATDQFGGKMKLKGVKLVEKPKFCSLKKGGLLVADKAGEGTLTMSMAGRTATMRVVAKSVSEIDLARMGVASASSQENGGLAPGNATDGDPKTRWGSAHKDGEWLMVDLNDAYKVTDAVLVWENARAVDYDIEASADGEKWVKAAEVRGGKGGTEEVALKPIEARYVRVRGLKRNTGYGISLFSLSIYSKETK